MHSSPAVEGNLPDVEALTETLDELFDVSVVDGIAFCGFDKSLLFPDAIAKQTSKLNMLFALANLILAAGITWQSNWFTCAIRNQEYSTLSAKTG